MTWHDISREQSPVKQFNLYDLIAVVAPGAVLVIGFTTLFPELGSLLGSKELTVGEFGVMLIASYISGNLLGPVAHLVEAVWFKLRGGNPTDRIQQKDSKVLHKAEVELLNERLRSVGMLGCNGDLRGIPAAHWKAIVRQIRAFIATRGPAERIEVFNAHYGLNRGIATACTVLMIAVIVHVGPPGWRAIAGLASCTVLAAFRMNDFGHYYATELIRQFIQFTDNAQTKSKTNEEGD